MQHKECTTHTLRNKKVADTPNTVAKSNADIKLCRKRYLRHVRVKMNQLSHHRRQLHLSIALPLKKDISSPPYKR